MWVDVTLDEFDNKFANLVSDSVSLKYIIKNSNQLGKLGKQNKKLV